MRIGNRTAIISVLRVALPLCMLFLAARPAFAERLPIKTYTTADGLPRDHIRRIVQDSKGYLWFCTSEGLSRFDGYKFTNYGIERGLSDRQVNDFLETRNGVYWVATGNGLCRFDPDSSAAHQTFTVYYPSDDPDARGISAILEDHLGTIWCATSEGLFRLDEVNGEPVFSFVDIVQPAGKYNRLRVEAIIEDRRGALWIAAPAGLYRRQADGAVELYTAAQGMREGQTKSLLEDRNGRIWVGSAFGLYELVTDPRPNQSIVDHVYGLKGGLNVAVLCESSDGTLYAGTPSGLSVLLPAQDPEGRRLQPYDRANGLSNTEIMSLCQDRAGNLWIGTDAGGTMRLAANGFVTYQESDGLGGTRVASIFEDRAGELCMISSNGFLHTFDGRRFSPIPFSLPGRTLDQSWGWNQITFQDSAGEWWIATFDGLIRYPRLASAEQISHTRPRAIYTSRQGLSDNTIFRLFEDHRGDIWISTVGNPDAVLTRWDRASETFHRYSPADGIPRAAPTAFCEDGAHNLWIGFYDGGLLRYAGGRFELFSDGDGLPPGMTRGLYLDHAGRLWIATGQGGVARLDNPAVEHPQFVNYSMAEGLSSNQATCITEDAWGMIYIGTGRGVDKLDPATGRITHYTTADGLSGSFINVSFRDRRGSLWFGTLQGLSRLVPQKEAPAPPPPILITALRIAGVPYRVSELGAAAIDGPELPASRNNIQIDFAGLSLAAGESLRYQYKLEGASIDWSAPADQRSVIYPNLAPGSYRFLVRAISSGGSISEVPAGVRFKILRPVWQRWWFITSVAALASLLVYAFYRYRVARLLEIERVRTRIAADLHDDIGTNLARIGILSEVAHSLLPADDHNIGSPLGSIAQISRESVASMGDIVWSIDPARDHLIDLVQRMRRFAGELFASGNIQFQFHAPAGEEELKLGAEVRRDVFLIYREALNNAARHAECSLVTVDLVVEGSRLVLEISDDGKGFDSSASGEGQGLASMKRRAADIGGDLRIDSAIGKGTSITLTTSRRPR